MRYDHLKSIVAARKQEIALAAPIESFSVASVRPRPYIEPTFSKIEFPNENPSIIFVQAIGASGKTTTASALSYDIKIPVLDLAKHAAVGDRTLTGVLTDAYSRSDLSTVFTGFSKGAYGVIIDGIDESRSKTTENAFEAFLNDILGYPPVLDAIVTLLNDEQNHYSIRRKLEDEHSGHIEAGLLIKVSDHLLDREHEKAVSNVIDTMIQGIPRKEYLKERLYNRQEQCARILARAQSLPFPYDTSITWPKEIDEQQREQLNRDYEKRIENLCAVHPFLRKEEDSVRNSVFSAVAIMYCAFSEVPEYRELAYDYANSHQPTYHLLYIMDAASKLDAASRLDARMFNPLIQSSSDRLTLDTDIDMRIGGRSWEEDDSSEDRIAELEIEMERPGGVISSFCFSGEVTSDVVLGPNLTNLSVTLPCTVQLSHRSRIVIRGSCSISASTVRIYTSDLTVRAVPTRADGADKETSELFIDARSVEGHVDRVPPYGTISIQAEGHDLVFPLARYVSQRTESFDEDEELGGKFLRIRRILMEFKARRRGGLARYQDKIENRRVLRNDVGKRILLALIAKDVVTLDGHLYRLDMDACSRVLGVTWQQLRKGETSPRLRDFLVSVE